MSTPRGEGEISQTSILRHLQVFGLCKTTYAEPENTTTNLDVVMRPSTIDTHVHTRSYTKEKSYTFPKLHEFTIIGVCEHVYVSTSRLQGTVIRYQVFLHYWLLTLNRKKVFNERVGVQLKPLKREPTVRRINFRINLNRRRYCKIRVFQFSVLDPLTSH